MGGGGGFDSKMGVATQKMWCATVRNLPLESNIRWKPPEAPFIKVNIDASWVSTTSAGLGVVIRDFSGNLLAWYVKKVDCYSPEMAEALAIQLGTCMAIDRGEEHVIVESDAKGVIELIDKQIFNKNWQIYHILRDIRRRSTFFRNVRWQWASQEANRVADMATSLATGTVDLGSALLPAPSLVQVLKNDGLPALPSGF